MNARKTYTLYTRIDAGERIIARGLSAVEAMRHIIERELDRRFHLTWENYETFRSFDCSLTLDRLRLSYGPPTFHATVPITEEYETDAASALELIAIQFLRFAYHHWEARSKPMRTGALRRVRGQCQNRCVRLGSPSAEAPQATRRCAETDGHLHAAKLLGSLRFVTGLRFQDNQLAQNCHKRRSPNHPSQWQRWPFPEGNHSIGNEEVDSSILSGSTIYLSVIVDFFEFQV